MFQAHRALSRIAALVGGVALVTGMLAASAGAVSAAPAARIAPSATMTVTNPGDQTDAVGAAVSVQIEASDSLETPAPYIYTATGLPTGVWINSTTGLIAGTPLIPGTYHVSVTADDWWNDDVTGSTSFTWTITGSGCPAVQALGNPGFEDGRSINPWLESGEGGFITGPPVVPVHSGSWAALVETRGNGDLLFQPWVEQTVTLPAACANATFSFWLSVNPTGPVRPLPLCRIDLQVLDGSGAVLQTLATFSNLDSADYTQHTYNLSGYAGQTITLRFIANLPFGQPIVNFAIDDTALDIS